MSVLLQAVEGKRFRGRPCTLCDLSAGNHSAQTRTIGLVQSVLISFDSSSRGQGVVWAVQGAAGGEGGGGMGGSGRGGYRAGSGRKPASLSMLKLSGGVRADKHAHLILASKAAT